MQSASAAKDITSARQALGKAEMRDGSLTAVFERTGKGKVSYSHVSHTREETRAEIVKWVSESMRPLSVVEDDGFRKLMKTGRPEYYIPSRRTVARDINQVFKNTRKRVANMLQVRSIPVQKKCIEVYSQKHVGALHFATDAWTSPNHKALIAITVHFEQDGVPISFLLDVVEVARSHTGANLAIAFAAVLDDFGIAEKVSSCPNFISKQLTTENRSSPLLATMRVPTMQ